MNIAAWVVQGVHAAFYRVSGGAKDRPKVFLRFVGTAEILGTLGIVFPLLTGIRPSAVDCEGEPS